MFFLIVFACGFFIQLLFTKTKSNWLKWFPTCMCLSLSLLFGLKAMFFPAPEMAVLGEVIYFMNFGVAAIGAALGVLLTRYYKYNNKFKP